MNSHESKITCEKEPPSEEAEETEKEMSSPTQGCVPQQSELDNKIAGAVGADTTRTGKVYRETTLSEKQSQ